MPRGRHRPPAIFRGYFVNLPIGENMIPCQAILESINNALATDTTLWGSIAPSAIMIPVINNFVPSVGLQPTDLTPATFTGGAAINIPIPPQVQILDNLSGRVGVLLNEPVGGFKWFCTVAPAAEEVVYGWAILDSGSTVVLFSDILPVPITIKEAGNFVEVPSVLAYLVNQPYGNLPAV